MVKPTYRITYLQNQGPEGLSLSHVRAPLETFQETSFQDSGGRPGDPSQRSRRPASLHATVPEKRPSKAETNTPEDVFGEPPREAGGDVPGGKPQGRLTNLIL